MGENNSIERKRSIISRSSETMCMPMAISICFLKTCRTASPGEWKTLTSEDKGCMADKVLKYRSIPMWFYRHVTDKGRKTCINFAKRLCELADVSTDKPCNIKEIERFEKVRHMEEKIVKKGPSYTECEKDTSAKPVKSSSYRGTSNRASSVWRMEVSLLSGLSTRRTFMLPKGYQYRDN
ncbi:unnamed protein product [Mytilus coruscus]|uniref:Uncharacterized protein n=1 Tax=Mytilus coruscus TaxID=42192 RepID=A0A6J8D234_MYTCO|nr:unnamed protein product [Mytilus coruscus]